MIANARKSHVALFGSVPIKRQYCRSCKSMALVLDGVLACCDAAAASDQSLAIKREVTSDGIRRQPGAVADEAKAHLQLRREQKGWRT